MIKRNRLHQFALAIVFSLAVCLFVSLCSSSLAQPLPKIAFGEVLWVGRSGGDFVSNAVSLSDGGFLLYGESAGSTPDVSRTWAARTNAQGEAIWEFFEEAEGQYCIYQWAVELPDGRFALVEGLWPTGRLLFVTPEGELDGEIVLSDGTLLFFPIDDGFIAIGQDPSQMDVGGWPNFVQRLDATWSPLWQYAITLDHNEVWRYSALADDGIFLGGVRYDREMKHFALMVRKLDMDGNVVFSYAEEPVPGTRRAVWSIEQGYDGDIIVVGYASDEMDTQGKVFVLQMDRHGELIWQKQLMSDVTIQRLLTLGDSQYLIGTNTRLPHEPLRPWLLLIDEDANILAEGFPPEPFKVDSSMSGFLHAPDGSIYMYETMNNEAFCGIVLVRVDLPVIR